MLGSNTSFLAAYTCKIKKIPDGLKLPPNAGLYLFNLAGFSVCVKTTFYCKNPFGL